MRTKIFLIVLGMVVCTLGGFTAGTIAEECPPVEPCKVEVQVTPEVLDMYCPLLECDGGHLLPTPDGYKCIGQDCTECPELDYKDCPQPRCPPRQVPPEVEFMPAPTGYRWHERLGVTGGATWRANDVEVVTERCGSYYCKTFVGETDGQWAGHLGLSYDFNSPLDVHVLATRDKGTWGATALATWWF